MIGDVKWYDRKKGFGFIKCADKEYFVHITDVMGSLEEDKIQNSELLRIGDKVEFTPSENKKGLIATQVSKINS